MPKNPPIVMARGTGWSNAAWEDFKPALDNAAEQAEQGLSAQGIAFDEWKLGVVDRCAKADMEQFSGVAFDAGRFRLLVDKTIAAPSHRDVALWAGIVTHEATHCARFERVIGMTVLKWAATEGLSYSTEHEFSLGGRNRRPRFFDFDLTVNPRIASRIKAITERGEATLVDEHWLNDVPHIDNGLRNIDYFGLHHVQAQLRSGYKIKDLLSLPAEEVLGL